MYDGRQVVVEKDRLGFVYAGTRKPGREKVEQDDAARSRALRDIEVYISF